jgi:hypothetical protein
MMQRRSGRCRACIVAATTIILPAVVLTQPAVADGNGVRPTQSQPVSAAIRTAQLPRVLASGTHQCGQASEKRSCVVSGEFSDCNEARGLLQTRDCCPSSAGGGRSAGFTLLTCIPNISGR